MLTHLNSRMTIALFTFVLLILTGCGGGGGGAASSSGFSAAQASLSFEAVKTFRFTWTDVADATHYQLFENADGSSGFTQVSGDIAPGEEEYDHTVPLYARMNAEYILRTCENSTCKDGTTMTVSGNMVDAIGYFKASNTEAADFFGSSVSLSSDGNTLAVGAENEDSDATGVSGTSSGTGSQSNNDAEDSGAVYIFQRSDTGWNQQAYIKASNTDAGDGFGYALSLSDDGNTLAVGAFSEDSAAIGIDGGETDNSASGAGAVYVFRRSGTTWSQQAYVKASNTEAGDKFGWSVSLSENGNTLAVGATSEDSNATEVGGDESDNSAASSGAVYVFTYESPNWSQQAYIKALPSAADDSFGSTVSLSDNGNRLAIGAPYDNDSFGNTDSGAVYIYSRSSNDWSFEDTLRATTRDSGDWFGSSVSLSGNGRSVAVGALFESSNATGIGGNASNNDASRSGAAYIFTFSGSVWSMPTYIKADNTDADDYFGNSIALSSDGNILAVGAFAEDSGELGINGDASDNSANAAGAAYVFSRSGDIWSQTAYLKSINTATGDNFGIFTLGLSGDGDTIAASSVYEESNATGIDGDTGNNDANAAGAVYLY